jgi:Rap1a immunity proteins
MQAVLWGALMMLTITTANAADTNSANFMVPYCKLNQTEQVANKAYLNGLCNGTVQAIVNMYGLIKLYGDKLKEPVDRNSPCADIPERITYEQAVRVVTRYADTHPERTHLTFTILVMLALEDAWPCKPRSPQLTQ